MVWTKASVTGAPTGRIKLAWTTAKCSSSILKRRGEVFVAEGQGRILGMV